MELRATDLSADAAAGPDPLGSPDERRCDYTFVRLRTAARRSPDRGSRGSLAEARGTKQPEPRTTRVVHALHRRYERRSFRGHLGTPHLTTSRFADLPFDAWEASLSGSASQC
jgi:hypothetical protein